jgi:hypothetical protein
MSLTLSLVTASLALAAAPVRLDRVDVLSEDTGTFSTTTCPWRAPTRR